MTTNELFEQALALPKEQRAQLAQSLWETLEPEPSPQVTAAWDDEIRRRLTTLKSGQAETYDLATVREHIQARLLPKK